MCGPSTCRRRRANGGFLSPGPLCASGVAAVSPPTPSGRMRAFSERESVHVWDVTQTRAAQHSRLFKGPFILLQLVQLLKTDKQDLELRAAENRPPTPLLKPLRPGPTLHCDWEKKRQTKVHKQEELKYTGNHQRNGDVKKINKEIKIPIKSKAFLSFQLILFIPTLRRNWPSGIFVLNFYQILLPISQ